MGEPARAGLNEVTVRPAQVDELEALFELQRDIYATTDFMCSAFDEKYADFEAFRSDFHQLSARPGFLYLVAQQGQKSGVRSLGYLTLTPHKPAKLAHTADLNMGVHPDSRGLGVGHRLVAEALDRARGGGIVQIVYLAVRRDNEAGVRLYHRAGFETLAVLERDTRIGDRYLDGVLMRLFLRRD